MSLATWGELKAFIDRELKRQGGGDNSPVEYIDISWVDDRDLADDADVVSVVYGGGTVAVFT